jgi:purine nucleosidase
VVQWLRSGGDVAAFYERISRKTREWSADRRGDHWHSADGVAMAYALQPDGALETAERALDVALDGPHSRGATIVDWQRQTGRPDRARILLRYDQARFEALVRGAVGAA